MIEVNWAELESIPTPGPQPNGIAWDGSTLWIADDGEHRIYRLNLETKRIQFSFRFIGVPAGMAWDGKNLWQTDSANRKIDQINRRGRVAYSLYLQQGENLTGLTACGESLWQASYEGIWYKINPTSGKIEHAYNWGHHVVGIVHDGSEFWYVEDETPGVHQISQLLGSNQISYKIGGKPKGITWDGSSFWIADVEAKAVKRFKP
jgi:hypothetical protein